MRLMRVGVKRRKPDRQGNNQYPNLEYDYKDIVKRIKPDR